MKRYISYFLFFSCLMVLTPLYAGTQTLTTYYPAPQGDYKNMDINAALTFPTEGSCTTQAANSNTVVLVNDNGVLQVCDENGTYSLTANSLWAHGSTGNYIYTAPISPATTNPENVGIGTWSVDPGYTLGVDGTVSISGETDMGGKVVMSQNLVVNGAATFNSTLSVTGTSLSTFSGNVGIGTTADPGYALGVIGSSNFNGDVIVNPSTNLQVNGQQSNTTVGIGTAAGTYPAIYVCNSGGLSCGYLAVKQSTDSNYYAVYAP